MNETGTYKTDEAIEFGRWLSRQRKARDLTQEDLAERIGCSVWSIQKFEVGNRRPSKQVAEMLADFFSIPAEVRAAFLRFARGQENQRDATELWKAVSGEETPRAKPDHDTKLIPERALPTHPSNLPLQLTSFVGRAVELPRVRDIMLTSEVRLLTLTGPPGTGKTRLALQVAAELLRDFDDGVFFVNLAPITDPDLVVSEIAQTLGVGESEGKSLQEGIEKYFGDRRLLMLLDNFEQVVGAAPVIGQLLMKAPGLKVLVTSRMPLHIRGEKEFAVPPLHLPDLQHLPPVERIGWYESVRLFTERARDVSGDFELTEDNAIAVAQICTRLDGLPLAIELAAARAKVLSPQTILSRLQNRLSLLTTGPRDLPLRQQTLRSAIEWSYDLLSDEEKTLFRRLAVFQGGRTLEAIEAVCKSEGESRIQVLDSVQSLVNSSLLKREEGTNGVPRFVMLETIHEFAEEKLQESGEANTFRREHALFFMRLAEEAEAGLKGPEQQEWLHKLDDEHDNMRAAIRWCALDANNASPESEEAVGTGLRLAGALWRFWLTRGYWSEGRRQLVTVLALGSRQWAAEVTSLGEARAKALNGAGALAWRQGDNASARTLHEESLAIGRELDDKAGIANSLHNLGIIAYTKDDYALARSLYEESLAIRRELGDKWSVSSSLDALGGVAEMQGDYATARSLYEEGLAVRRELGDKVSIARSLSNLGVMVLGLGDHASARSLLEESLTIRRELNDKWGISISLFALARLAHKEGDAQRARELFVQTVALSQEIGDWPRVALWLAEFGGMAGAGNQPLKGARLLSASEALLEAAGDAWRSHRGYNRSLALVRSRLDDETFKQAWQEGRAMTIDDAIAYALEG